MPKSKSSKSIRVETPYSIGEIKSHLKNWKSEALDYEKKTKVHFDQIRGYLGKHMNSLNSNQVIDLYDAVSRALDQIERKTTVKISRMDNYITSLVEDQNLDAVCPFILFFNLIQKSIYSQLCEK